MAAMFSNTRSTPMGSGNILEFKAGKSNLEPGTTETMRKVVADPRKGLVYIKQSNDMLIHFCWKDRENGAVIDDLIIFPDDAEFKAVSGCPDGKVFMLKFKSSKDMRLYWLQDGSPDADKDLVKKVNDALNKPATARPSAGRSSNAVERSGGANFTSNLAEEFGGPGGPLGALDQSQLISLIQSLQGSGSDALPLPASSSKKASETDCEPPEQSSSTPLSGKQDFSKAQLTQILSSFRPNAGQTEQKKNVSVSLSDALSTDKALAVARDHVKELAQHLPENENDLQELVETIKSPQFRQAADSFGHALQTGQAGPVLSQFGVNDETIQSANAGDIKGFAANLTKAEGESSSEGQANVSSDDDATKEPEPKRNRPDLDDMDVD